MVSTVSSKNIVSSSDTLVVMSAIYVALFYIRDISLAGLGRFANYDLEVKLVR